MEILDIYLQYINEAEEKPGTIIDMQKSKCSYIRKLFDSSRRDLGVNDAKTIRLRAKLDSCESHLDTISKSVENKGKAAKVSANVGQGIGKTTNVQRRHEELARQAQAQSEVDQARDIANEVYHTVMAKATSDCAARTDKSACMRRFNMQAIQAAKSQISKGFSACNHTKDANKCMEKLRKQMDNFDNKLRKLTT